METVNCDFCGCDDAEILVRQKDIVHCCAPADQEFYLRKCRKCGLIYLNPRLSADELFSYYPDNYVFYTEGKIWLSKIKQYITDLACTPHINKPIALLFHLFCLKRQFLNLMRPRKNNYLESMEPCRFLDIGCGSGLNTHFWGYAGSLHSLKARGFEVIGIEPCGKARVIAKKYGIKVFSSFSELKGRQFDCIRMNWSLEHVDSPSRAFFSAKEALREGGRLLIAVPNYSGILYRLFPNSVEVPVHNYYFTIQTLENYFIKFGFKIIDKFTFSYPGMFADAFKFLRLKPIFAPAPLEAVYFQSLLDKFDLQLLGNDMVYLCEK